MTAFVSHFSYVGDMKLSQVLADIDDEVNEWLLLSEHVLLETVQLQLLEALLDKGKPRYGVQQLLRDGLLALDKPEADLMDEFSLGLCLEKNFATFDRPRCFERTGFFICSSEDQNVVYEHCARQRFVFFTCGCLGGAIL